MPRPWLFGIAFLALFAACATSPMGRKQFIVIPDAQMDGLGSQSFEELKRKTPVSRDANWNVYVRCIAMPIAQVVDGGQGWEIVLFTDNTANAFALPGKKIGVHTGLLTVAKTDSQLAAVLGHEVAHVVARHGAERVSDGMAGQIAQVGLAAALSGALKSPGSRDVVFAGLGLLTSGVLLKFSRTHESEADLMGLDLMSTAGFDPRESVELWKNMAAQGGGQPPEFLSSHPSHESRIRDLEARIPQNISKFEAARAAGRVPQCRRPTG